MKFPLRTLAVCLLATPLAAQEINTSALSQNGWFSDDTRADGSGSVAEGLNLISDTLTDDPEASGSGTSTHDADINDQILFAPAAGTVPFGTHLGAVQLRIDGGGGGKSQISHRKDDVSGHGPGSGFGPGFSAEYSWMGDGTVSVTASLKFGIKTSEYGATAPSGRTGENVWDKVLIYEPGNLNGGTSDGTWQTEYTDHTTGLWWFFDRTAGAGTIGTPMTLADMAVSPTLVGGGPKTVADVYALITGGIITSVQFGIGSGNAGGSVYVNQLETTVYRSGMTTTFACGEPFYANDFEVDDFGWNVFGAGFESTRVASGTNGVTSASGSWHCEADTAAGNWGGYSGVCGCASSGCAGPVSTFPTGGYITSVDIYLDVDGGFANDTRFDFSSAVNNTTGTHRRDFVFNGSFLDSTEVVSVGAGLDRFVLAASNNTPGWAQGGIDPVAITTSGWYTFEHRFYDSGSGVLACDFVVLDTDGDEVASWTRSDASDVIGSTVGGNRYAWFVTNEFPFLAFDNASRQPGPYDQNVTPDILFGSGNINGSFTVDRVDGVELGLRGKLRFDENNAPQNEFMSNGDGTYTFAAGSPTAPPPLPGWAGATTPFWSFEWSVNTDYDDSTAAKLSDYTYELGMDFDPSLDTDYLTFDHITPSIPVPFYDHAIGDNTTPNGGGTSAGDAPTYLALLAANNIAQNSWTYEFFNDTPYDTFDPNVAGRYEVYMRAFDGATQVAESAITIIVADGATLSLEANPCQMDQNASLGGTQIEVELWLRNPDDEDVSGYQAFLEFDDGAMTYEGSASSYTAAPFDIHIQGIATAEVAAGELRLDGNTFTETDGDAKLATLVFTVAECDTTSVAFDLGQAFDSEVSFGGSPLATSLEDSPSILSDDTAPVLAGTPANFSQPADAGSCLGAVVSWTDPTATDNCDPSPTVVCSPASGSFFPVGVTTVTCTATDECGNESSETFDVTVTATNAVDVVVQLTGSVATSRCVTFVPDSCGSSIDTTLAFVAAGPNAVATTTIEIPCGVWTSLCSKDEQHTKWGDTTLSIVGNKYVADSTIVLDGGDTDNDGDVDINDVTLFLAQFGDIALSGGCPWDGTRDADFSNNGAVGSEDYSSLTTNWLTTSSCGCSLVSGPDKPKPRSWARVTNATMAAVDYNQDGRIDVEDVEIFEDYHGFSRALSKRMRASRR